MVYKPKAVAIVGPTASGKTDLSIFLAKKFSGEVISADSRQVYLGLDIGTAKVTKAEMDGVPHHLIDVCDPTNVYTGADFIRDGNLALTEITNRQKLPIIAGGTFFYLDLLKGKMAVASVPPNPDLRADLETKTLAELVSQLIELDPLAAKRIDNTNPRRLIRANEVATALGSVPLPTIKSSPYHWLTIGIDISLAELESRLAIRTNQRLDQGMVEEVESLHKNGLSWDKLETFGLEYRYIARYLQNMIDRETMVTEINIKSRQFAKRQKTWLKRDPDIIWLPAPVDYSRAEQLVKEFLNQPNLINN